MKSVLKAAAVVSALVVGAGVANANDELKRLIADENNWATPTKDYAATRYSKLDQINKGNVGNMQVAWTFSTGVLRGHEGGPLVIGDGFLYIHTAIPNKVFK
ncbi:MAG: PQQ-dependent dehydrogenase, methanol/ethanol family, partial [Pseudomonadota bacterium]|nr:PQQ-dependent dehydrogenase, methanol/ethanol family [Pseudomonadota bacterium]